MKPNRPLIYYFGGKWNLAPWIIQHMPKHSVYVEPFGGGASVLLRKDPVLVEVYNDLYDELYNLFCVLRHPEQSQQLYDLLKLTPYSRKEFESAYNITSEPVEKARRLIVRSWQGFGSGGGLSKVGFSTNTTMRNLPNKWAGLVDSLPLIIERLRNVTIDNVDAFTLFSAYDSSDTLFYIDPPYPLETRQANVYMHEMTDNDHVRLFNALDSLQSMVIVSGYNCDLYEALYKDWHKVESTGFYAERISKQQRTEVIWINPLAYERLQASQPKQLAMF